MGRQDVSEEAHEQGLRTFTQRLLRDVRALERLLEHGAVHLVESGTRRIGAEQEMFLIDAGHCPAPTATEVLENLEGDPRFTTELAKFNLEANLPAYVFGGNCLSRMEGDLRAMLDKCSVAAQAAGSEILLTGILPTLRLEHLGLDNMTPVPRYYALNREMTRLRGGEFLTKIKGIDELYATHDNVMLESCNTSFQIHFQVDAHEFARLYNLAQAITAPLLAAAVNSPVLLGHRLWHETRVALFQQSVDARSETHKARGNRKRVRFGDQWVEDSIVELFKEDIARSRVVLAAEIEGDSVDQLDSGEAPSLEALRLHNGTIYRWNRPCYGVVDGIAHLRIENRVLPAGPTVIDEMANASFFFGMMAALEREYPDIRERMTFEDTKENFLSAARYGLKAQFTWVDGKRYTATELILDHLLPAARSGLREAGIDAGDIDRYLGVLEDRVRSGQTASHWALASLQRMSSRSTRDSRSRALTAAILTRQKTSEPVHTWPLAELEESGDWRDNYRTVGQFMTTDLLTVRPGDLVDLAASLMDWERIRHVPVEDDEGRLVGLVSTRTLVRLLAQGGSAPQGKPVAVHTIMKPDPVTVAPDTRTLVAMQIMRDKEVGSLPVVEGDRLVGIITERDLIEMAAKLVEDQLREREPSGT